MEEGGLTNVYAVEPKMYVDEAQGFGFDEHAEKLQPHQRFPRDWELLQ
jgi:hypothetical protein